MFFYCPIVLILEFITSYLLNSGALAIIGKKMLRAAILSALTNICTWGAFYVVVKIGDWNVLLMMAASTGDIMADTLVAGRQPKWLWKFINPPRKKIFKKQKYPVTTA